MRYILFAGDDYYPEGGAHDFRGFIYTMYRSEAIAIAEDILADIEPGSDGWADLCSDQMQVLESWECNGYAAAVNWIRKENG